MGTTVISHGDLDGITAGAIGLLALPGSFFYFSKPSNIAQDLFRAAKDNPEEVIVSDIALNTSRLNDIVKALRKFPKSSTIHWIDHHPMPTKHKKTLSQHVELFHKVGPCGAELVYRKFQDRLPEHAIRLALYGAIGDYCDATEFALRHLEDYDKRTLYLEAGLLVQALQEIDYRKESRDLVKELTLGIEPSSMNNIVALAIKATRIEHQVFRYVKGKARKLGSVGYVLDMPIGGYRGKSAKFAAYVTDSQIGISARSSNDDIDMSIRLRNSKVNLNKALESILSELPGAHGGGHPQAAGASMDRNDFPKFLQRLADYVDNLTKV